MKKQLLHALRGPVSRKLQLLLFLLICIYVFQQVSSQNETMICTCNAHKNFHSNFIYHNHFSTKKAITTFGYNPYIEDNIGIQSGNYYPSPNSVIGEKSVRNRQKWNKNDAGMTSIYEILLQSLYH